MSLQNTFFAELATLGLPRVEGPGDVITDAEIAALPPNVQRYMRFMGVPGRTRDRSFLGHFHGRIRLRPQREFMPMEIWQFNMVQPVTRVFYLSVGFFGFVPVIGRDTYLSGKGRMLIRPLDAFTVEAGQGPPFDTGELVTFLNDCILISPSMLLGLPVTWHDSGAGTFEVTLDDAGTRVSATVTLDDRGAPIDFSTVDRFGTDLEHPKGPQLQMRWTTPIAGWTELDGRPFITQGAAVWHPPQHPPWTYAEFGAEGATIRFNAGPFASSP